MLKKATTRRAKTKLFWQGSFYITTQRMPVAYAYRQGNPFLGARAGTAI
jgi:hypothetical protein